MKAKILETLHGLRSYARTKECEVSLHYHEEDSYLMRFANSAISLNTNEHLIRLDVTAYLGRHRASYSMITDLAQVADMRRGIDRAAEMVKHSQPLSYDPTVPLYEETFIDDTHYDPTLAGMGNVDRLGFMNAASEGLESDQIALSGIFSCGSNTTAMTNTRSENLQYFRTSDAQISVVLAHRELKWEVSAEQSAHNRSALDPASLRAELAFLVDHYHRDPAAQLPLGPYDIVFGPAATAEMLSMLNWIGFNGGLMKRGYSFLTEDQVGSRVFSDQFNLLDDPEQPETFPFKRDFAGLVREPYPIFRDGEFLGFVWSQDDADEFGAKATGHTVPHKSLVLGGGDHSATSLTELVVMSRAGDILYVPFLHYMNIVNPSKGIITASSRFGALLLKQDGTVVIPYNVRLTQSLPDIFGDRVEWLSRECVPYNTSNSYGARNPTAVMVPKYLKANDLAISHSNESY